MTQNKIVLSVKGGVVQGAQANIDIDVNVVDFDDLEAEGIWSSEFDDIWEERTAGLFPVY